jgi:hypothetical protein
MRAQRGCAATAPYEPAGNRDTNRVSVVPSPPYNEISPYGVDGSLVCPAGLAFERERERVLVCVCVCVLVKGCVSVCLSVCLSVSV